MGGLALKINLIKRLKYATSSYPFARVKIVNPAACDRTTSYTRIRGKKVEALDTYLPFEIESYLPSFFYRSPPISIPIKGRTICSPPSISPFSLLHPVDVATTTTTATHLVPSFALPHRANTVIYRCRSTSLILQAKPPPNHSKSG
ncbi:uncharacterized protein CLUP02_00069 [Colletotrichum lupini]|uniref:Uncharacterized protein n=1 Tax=Colletotrichum lupini TaxID=145971 RepID=A0A9Q8S9Z3_9PEZI|nr:uncharacterized protein CLUP02_00069 [Colletotrichum lupini]UQC73425.1 hypothetical protein CLUP02_00069 [Colletotrichum lupini]